jgi:hypothetical protein
MSYYKLSNEAIDKAGKDKKFAEHEAAVGAYVNKLKDEITEDPTFWDELLMTVTGC